MSALFVSDLHLCRTRPAVNEIFFDFLRGPALQADSLYILGDLFEYWAGDDDLDDALNAEVVRALAECAQRGPSIQVMHGNRDFLMGHGFEEASATRLLHDPLVLDLHGVSTILSHGDTLCTDDVEYQQFRREVRTPAWKHRFLAQPLAQRKQFIEEMRARSESEKRQKPAEIMDVNGSAVTALLDSHASRRLIHGHTHRQARHEHVVAGATCERWVLGDWHETGNVLVCDEHGCRFQELR
jgi:UDP-2,3-diacylglucosamine hydrolase